MAILNAIATILSLAVFFGIVWWAFSAHRRKDNEQAANLPFDLPDEGAPTQKKQSDQNNEVK
ncbi:cbb3-type cytochrome oxidase subunit 3 [Orrella sp. 11846]|uniref:cbb3-type cytochrome oxidase subunit 3 n=1 Tax=Orrella sp. 11846 TaxID=3409913 RepID=UPI003B5A2498